MIDILILDIPNSPTKERAINSILNQENAPPYKIHTIPYTKNPIPPGSFYNAILHECTNPVFTILQHTDFYTPDAFSSITDFIKFKRFGLVYASSFNQNNNQVNKVNNLPLIAETIYSTNPMQAPVFYNRKIVDFLLAFDCNTEFPEFDMTLKIWERFPVYHLNMPLIYAKSKVPYISHIYELERLVYQSKVRSSKYFYHAGPNLFPDSLLEPIL